MKYSTDSSIRPQDDYFLYVNNTWLENNPIPKSESSWGTFYTLRDSSWRAVHAIANDLLTTEEVLDSSQLLLKDFFQSAFEYGSNSTAHFETLSSELSRIDKIKNHKQLAAYLGHAHRHDINVFWAPFVGLDDKKSTTQVLNIFQAGLGLPNRDYYLEDSPDMLRVRKEYKQYFGSLRKVTKDYLLMVDTRATLSVEAELAQASWTDVELRDVEKNYTRYSLNTLKESFASFDWELYFKELGWKHPSDNIVVGQPSYLHECLKLIENTSLTDIRSYLSWSLVNQTASWVTEETAHQHFLFYGVVIGGMSEMKPLWKRVTMLADRLIIGEVLGKEYASRHFPESSKLAVLDIVHDIRLAYHKRIDSLSWMKQPTKERAHKKLDNIKVFIGYPSKWKNLDELSFDASNLIENIFAARRFENDLDLEKVGTPPAAEEWEMNAQTVNAYHHPNRLEIVFPAAILQPPFFDPSASYAENLGGIGAVIGHEFTHGFDDQGSQFDEHGNVKPWQSSSEREHFEKLASIIVEQADAFETTKNVFLQGQLVLGEAIADIGGLQLAVEALKMKDPSLASIDDLFLNFATAECGHATKEMLIQAAKTDPHPPSPFRVNNVVNHIDEFYDLYRVKREDRLYLPPSKRSHIW
jgi:putative endopeptidase